MDFGNGCYKYILGGLENIWSSSASNGTYGVITPSFGNYNLTPQFSGVTIIKGDSYVKYV